ncbi:unnamed protein product [Brassicogethes aeneus]|uniref:ZAD domain-containing protein n=1 Tax=Brassicogethes aeneus TaxID=1431903 RepID=A0A9P0AZI8_BRAAE|nr:unnamed protein product [Brassicogethes aeneus]
MEFECRLCPSTSSLISLFGGKEKKYRQLLNEILFETVGVKVKEEDSYSKCLCCLCVIKIFNFYKFKTLCLRKESIIRGVSKNKKVISLKNSESERNDRIQELQDWIVRKRNKCLENVNQTIDKEKTITKNATITNSETQTKASEIIENSTQTLYVEFTDGESQTICECVENGTQTNNTVSEQTTQTEICYQAFDYQPGDKTKEANTLSDTTDVTTDSAYDSDLQVCLEKQQKSNSNKDEAAFLSNDNIINNPMVLTKQKSIIVCKICSKVLNNNIQYKNHLKVHMRCNFCNKKFPSAAKLETHECEKKIKMKHPTVILARVDYHPEYQKYCMTPKVEENKPRKLIRSKSLSCLDSLQANSETVLDICFLKTVTTGKSKATQTLPIHDLNNLSTSTMNHHKKKKV